MTMPVAIFDSDRESTEDWLDKVREYCFHSQKKKKSENIRSTLYLRAPSFIKLSPEDQPSGKHGEGAAVELDRLEQP